MFKKILYFTFIVKFMTIDQVESRIIEINILLFNKYKMRQIA